MRYLGSKRRFADAILAVVLAGNPACYVEPFLGGGNIMEKVPSTIHRVGNDLNKYIIAMFKAAIDGWEPPEAISESEYYRMRDDFYGYRDKPELLGFAGVGCAFGGHWFAGYAKNDADNDYCGQSRATLKRQADALRGVELYSMDFRDLLIPEGATLYCDPPYEGTTDYGVKTSGKHYSTSAFVAWAEEKVLQGHPVFVSEYKGWDGWSCVWSREIMKQMPGRGESVTHTERLFTTTPDAVREKQRRVADAPDPFESAIFKKDAPGPIIEAAKAEPAARPSFDSLRELKNAAIKKRK